MELSKHRNKTFNNTVTKAFSLVMLRVEFRLVVMGKLWNEETVFRKDRGCQDEIFHEFRESVKKKLFLNFECLMKYTDQQYGGFCDPYCKTAWKEQVSCKCWWATRTQNSGFNVQWPKVTYCHCGCLLYSRIS